MRRAPPPCKARSRVSLIRFCIAKVCSALHQRLDIHPVKFGEHILFIRGDTPLQNTAMILAVNECPAGGETLTLVA